MCTKVFFPIFNSVPLWSVRVSKLGSIDCSVGAKRQSEWCSRPSLLDLLCLASVSFVSSLLGKWSPSIASKNFTLPLLNYFLIQCQDTWLYNHPLYRISWTWALFITVVKAVGNCLPKPKLNAHCVCCMCFSMAITCKLAGKWVAQLICIWWWTQDSLKSKTRCAKNNKVQVILSYVAKQIYISCVRCNGTRKSSNFSKQLNWIRGKK